MLTIVFAKLYYLTGEDKFYKEAKDLIGALYNYNVEPFSINSLLSGAALLEHGVHIKITGNSNLTYPLVSEAAKVPSPNIIIEQTADIESEVPTAQICWNGKCLPSVKTPSELVNMINKLNL